MSTRPQTVADYLATLPPDRRAAIEAVRNVIRRNLDPQYAEGVYYGMIGYCVPHSVYPNGYHCDPTQPLPFANLASRQGYMTVGLMSVYANAAEEAWFRTAWARTGKKLDMGKACIRFRKLEDLPLDVIGEAVRRMPAKTFIAHYEKSILTMNQQAAKRAGKAPARKARAATATTTRKGAARK